MEPNKSSCLGKVGVLLDVVNRRPQRMLNKIVVVVVFALAVSVVGGAQCGVEEPNGRTQNWPFGIGGEIGHNMVLPSNDTQGKEARLFGSCALPNEQLTFSGYGGDPKTITAFANGTFEVYLPAAATVTPVNITVVGNNSKTVETRSLLNVLYGDVWLCSGQSNMDMQVVETFDWQAVLAGLDPQTNIRFLPNVPHSTWAVSNQNYYAMKFSAVCLLTALHAGRLSARRADRAIGLVWHSRGGSSIEAWMDKKGLDACGVPSTPGTLVCDWKVSSLVFTSSLSVSHILWYQGETNVACNSNNVYACEMRELIRFWREEFGDGNPLPFLYVQLAGYGNTDKSSSSRSGDALPLLRESQRQALDVNATAMAITFDLGDTGHTKTPPSPHHGGIHPRNKTEVGRRLALALEQLENPSGSLVTHGPSPVAFQVSSDGGSVGVKFNQIGLLMSGTEDCQYLYSHQDCLQMLQSGRETARAAREGNELYFNLAGSENECEEEEEVVGDVCCEPTTNTPFEIGLQNGTFVLANWTIEGDTVTLKASTAVNGTIAAVRFGWQGFPLCVLRNSQMLPAGPFWKNITSTSTAAPLLRPNPSRIGAINETRRNETI